MRISLVQSDIIWEDKTSNLRNYDTILAGLCGKTDLVVLPEMCTTGFSMQTEHLAEFNGEDTLQTLQKMSSDYGFALMGSMISKSEPGCFNRCFFLEPNGKQTFYDKRHLFRMGDEPLHYRAGDQKVLISYLGWNIRPIICYDLRFPVWCRNVNNEYDLLVVVANWPKARRSVWKSLLTARALENMSYVCGVNRVGKGELNIDYSGDSLLIDAYGNVLTSFKSGEENCQSFEMELEPLRRFREKFPVWKDADRFEIL